MTSEAESTERAPIVRLLAGVDRRLRLNDAVSGLTKGLWGLVALLVLTKLFGLWDRPVANGALILVYGLALAGLVAWLYLGGWSSSRDAGLSRSAAFADSRADLKDALKSAWAFLGLPERTPWMSFQIRRTAAAAEELDARDIAPGNYPRSLPWAAGLGVALLALVAWNPSWIRGLDAPTLWPVRSQEDEALTAEVFEEDEVAAEAAEQKLEELESALERLRQQDLELTESLRDLEESQEALAARRMDMEQLQVDLDKIGQELSTMPALSELAEALKAQDAEKAAELLRELAERLSEAPSSEELQALLEALQNANVQQGDLASLMESLENASQSPDQRSLAEMAQMLEQAANQLESMGQQQMSPQQLDASSQEMQSLEASMGEQQAGGQQQMGQQQQQQGGQATQSASGMMSTQLQMAQMQGDPSSAVPVDAGPAGDATGPGGGDEQVLGEATTLDVQLEMEALKTEEREEPVPEEVFERLSREEKSTLSYESVQGRDGYAEESALSREQVPWPYRSLVKRYFLSILSSSDETSEPSSEK